LEEEDFSDDEIDEPFSEDADDEDDDSLSPESVTPAEREEYRLSMETYLKVSEVIPFLFLSFTSLLSFCSSNLQEIQIKLFSIALLFAIKALSLAKSDLSLLFPPEWSPSQDFVHFSLLLRKKRRHDIDYRISCLNLTLKLMDQEMNGHQKVEYVIMRSRIMYELSSLLNMKSDQAPESKVN